MDCRGLRSEIQDRGRAAARGDRENQSQVRAASTAAGSVGRWPAACCGARAGARRSDRCSWRICCTQAPQPRAGLTGLPDLLQRAGTAARLVQDGPARNPFAQAHDHGGRLTPRLRLVADGTESHVSVMTYPDLPDRLSGCKGMKVTFIGVWDRAWGRGDAVNARVAAGLDALHRGFSRAAITCQASETSGVAGHSAWEPCAISTWPPG